MSYLVENGIYFLDERLSLLEKKILDTCCIHLEEKGFKYLSIPSSIKWTTFQQQELSLELPILGIDNNHCLAGSAEQGILERFANQSVEPSLYYAKNQCFRNEVKYNSLLKVKEFIKVEQFCFCTEDTWKQQFEFLLDNATQFLKKLDIEYRFIDTSFRDKGYHSLKYDIEINTQTFGWVETHSCSYFATEQTQRFNISGANHTISNTGIATPRILIPFIEDEAKILPF